MRATLHASALLAALTVVAASAQPALAADTTTWSPALTTGSGAGVTVADGAARIDQRTAFLAPADESTRGAEGTADAVPTGLLTLRSHTLATPTNRVGTTVDAVHSDGSYATVDVRGLRASGNWSEWVPADDGTAVLPEPSRQVQARLVLTGDPGPVVTAVSLTALTPSQAEGASAAGVALTYRVFATREGLSAASPRTGTGSPRHDHFVALPSRRALSPNGSGDYSVRVCAAGGPLRDRPGLGRRALEHQGRLLEPVGPAPAVEGPAAGPPAGPGGLRERLQRRPRRLRPPGRRTRRASTSPTARSTASACANNAFVTVDYLWTAQVRGR